jgi:Tfp pilus assembly protein PilF
VRQPIFREVIPLTEAQSRSYADDTTDDLRATDASPRRNRALLIALGVAAIVVASFVAFAPALRGQFLWDDDYYVSSNRLLQSWVGLQRIWFDVLSGPTSYPLPQYYPMTHTSFWIEYRLWGLRPTGYHVTNVVLHVCSALLIWLTLRKLGVAGAWAAAALWAVHPLNVESVAWIAERKNVLSGFFFFASIYVYLRYAGVIRGPERPSEYLSLPRERERVYALALVLFLLAVLSKTVTATMPAVVLLVMWWKRRRITARDLGMLAPLFACGIALAALTSYMEQHRVGALGSEWNYPFPSRIVIAGQAFWFYLQKLVVPHPLIFNYPRPDPNSLPAWMWVYPIAAVALLGTLATLQRHIGRGPAAAMLYYAGTLFPAMGFVNVFPHRYAFVADHFAYLSIVGPIALVAALAAWAGARYLPRDGLARRAPLAGAAAVVLVALLVVSAKRSRVFAGPEELWEDTLRKNKQSWMAANNYGVYLRDVKGNLEAAQAWFESVIRKRPEHAESRYNMGVIAQMRGDRAAERRYYEEALRLRPNYAPALLRLGNILEEDGNFDEAEKTYRQILAANPNDYQANMALGFLLERQKRYDDALAQYQKGSDVEPDLVAPYVRIGNVLMTRGRFEEAMQFFAEASRLDPTNATVPNNVGVIFLAGNRLPEARVWFERALALNPWMVDAITNLGVVAARAGFPKEARQYFEKALEIDPKFAKARQNLTALEEGKLGPATRQSTTQPAPATAPTR